MSEIKTMLNEYASGRVVIVPVLYVDIDGTVRHSVDELGHFVNGPEDVIVFPEAVERMLEWKDRYPRGRVVGVTNQGGVALGHVTRANVVAGLEETARQCGSAIDAIFACFHHPNARDPLEAKCWCRKPSAGAVVEAAGLLRSLLEPERLHTGYPSGHSSILMPAHWAMFVGDRPEDAGCARAANLDFMSAADWRRGAPYPMKSGTQ